MLLTLSLAWELAGGAADMAKILGIKIAAVHHIRRSYVLP
jgi:hypothetical protein